MQFLSEILDSINIQEIPLWVFVLVALILLLFLPKLFRRIRSNIAFNRVGKEYLKWCEAQNGKKLVPLTDVSICLRKDERAFWEECACLIEPKSVRTYVSGGPSFRIARGVYFRTSVGRSKSHKELQMSDSGIFTFTDERLVFSGETNSFSIPLKKILSVKAHRDSVQFNCEGSRSLLIFVVHNSLIVKTLAESIINGLKKAGEL